MDKDIEAPESITEFVCPVKVLSNGSSWRAGGCVGEVGLAE